MKRFLLVNSPIYEDASAEDEDYLNPLGLGYIATYLEEAAHVDVVLLDCVKERMSVDRTVDYINGFSPDYLGINIFTPNFEFVRRILQGITAGCVCFIGGQVVKCTYEEILKWDVKNELYIIIGDGELIIPSIVAGKCRQEAEVCIGSRYVYRVDDRSPYFPKDISDIHLNRKFFKEWTSVNHYGQKEIEIVTSRGCVYNCAFCGGARDLNRDVSIRFRSKESVIRELNEVLSIRPDVQSVRILDDLFLRDDRSIDIANQIFHEFPKITWRGMAHVLSLRNAGRKIGELREEGCRELFIGIESGSERVRTHINKAGSVDDIVRVSTQILDCGIDLKGYFIYGFPGETRDDFEKTYELAARIREISTGTAGNFRTSVFQFRPYHGTRLYNEIMSAGGVVQEFRPNEAINQYGGRKQYNTVAENYSCENIDTLNSYINRTLGLSRESNNG